MALVVLAAVVGGVHAQPPVPGSPNRCLPRGPSRGWCGDGGSARRAKLAAPLDVAVSAGGFVVPDGGNNVVRRVVGGRIFTIAGDGVAGDAVPAVPAEKARFRGPVGVAVESDGSVLITDRGNNALRRIRPDGIVVTLEALDLLEPQGVLVTPAGIAVADTGHRRVLLLTADGQVVTVAGTGTLGYSGDGGRAIDAQLSAPTRLAQDTDGSLLIGDPGARAIRRVAPDGTISTYARLRRGAPRGLVAVPGRGVLVSDPRGLVLVAAGGALRRVAGSRRQGFNRERARGVSVRLNRPGGLAVDRDGSVLFADQNNDRIRRFTGLSFVSTVAGSGRPRLRRARSARAHGARVAARSCHRYVPRFDTFGFQPLDGRALRLKAGRRTVLRFATSRVARVTARLLRRDSDAVIATKTRTVQAGVTRKIKLRRYFAPGRYRAQLDGVAVAERLRRCDARKVRIHR